MIATSCDDSRKSNKKCFFNYVTSKLKWEHKEHSKLYWELLN